MRILVTGGCGFIGSNFLYYLESNPNIEQIINVDKLTYAGNISNLPSSSNIRNYIVDINNTDTIKTICHDNSITHVVHFAAESHVDNSIASPDEFIKTNINGTFSLLESVKGLKSLVKFHHVSTDEVYGSLEDDVCFFTETTPYDPRSPYSASKAASDHLVRAYHHTYNLPINISNCSNNYGPRQHQEKLIPKTIINILQGKQVPVYGSGQNIRDWLYVDDHCEGIFNILTKGTSGETYNIGGNCTLRNVEIISAICSLIGTTYEDVVTYVEDRPGHDYKYAIDCKRIHRELGWQPTTKLNDGLIKTIEYYTQLINPLKVD